MKPTSRKCFALLAVTLAFFSARAEETNGSARLPEPPDKEKLSYALGMNLALQARRSAIPVEVDKVTEALNDVLAGRPTELKESELRTILRQADEAGHLKLTSQNIARGEAFLAQNAKAPGVTVLPDGLQYQVIENGTGVSPKKIDIVTLKFRGTWINGAEFRHNDSLDIPLLGCTKGIQEALQLMKVGSRWKIFVPYHLAYGRVGERAIAYGSTLIYDLQLLAAEPESAHLRPHHSSGQAGHSLDEDLLPLKFQPTVEIH